MLVQAMSTLPLNGIKEGVSYSTPTSRSKVQVGGAYLY
jgi:hypothetical protein